MTVELRTKVITVTVWWHFIDIYCTIILIHIILYKHNIIDFCDSLYEEVTRLLQESQNNMLGLY